MTVDEYILNNPKFQIALDIIREAMLGCGMEETVKWSRPVYMINGQNIAGIGAFRNHIAIWYFHGSLLSDPENHLITSEKNPAQGMRQLRFNNETEIKIELIERFNQEAIKNQKSGKTVQYKNKTGFILPQELLETLKKDTILNENFNQFTVSKKREFCEFIANAKRKETRLSRLEKSINLIRNQIGLNDKYRK